MRFSLFIIGILLITSCARMGTPSGGPKDTEPPKYLNAIPDTMSLFVPVDLKEIKINFDEYLILKDYNQNILISPPMEIAPNFLPVGSPAKSISIKLNESLQPNTTYNINFGNAIQDNNEGNKLPYFQYVFSTGEYIDSLKLTGKASVPELRKQPENIVAALYKIDENYKDSLILNQKPFYIAKLEKDGSFKLNYLHEGKYQLIAFEDKVANLQFDFGQEKFGFSSEPVELHENLTQDLVLFNQPPDYKALKAEQKGYGHLHFKFQGQPESVEIEPLDFEFSTMKTSYEFKSDSLNFWFNPGIDSIAESSKRFGFLVKNLDRMDTLSVVYSNSVKHNLVLDPKNKLEFSPTRKVKFTANYPIASLDSALVYVEKDSVQLPVRMILDPKNENAFTVDFPIDLGGAYKMEFLPEAVTDFFGKTNDTLRYNFKIKTRNELGNLKLILQNQPEQLFWIQLMNEKEEILDTQYSKASVFQYDNLLPGNYYFRILVDENENGFWEPGDFFSRKQPEKAYIYPASVNVRALWDAEETWVVIKPEPIVQNEESPSEEEDSN
ncbi:MAG: Ig-like domain-containing protein [Weeksellaceae bacterium]